MKEKELLVSNPTTKLSNRIYKTMKASCSSLSFLFYFFFGYTGLRFFVLNKNTRQTIREFTIIALKNIWFSSFNHL